MRALRGAPGSKVSVTIIRGNANDPHVVELTRETEPASDVNGRMAATRHRVRARRGYRSEHGFAGEVADRRADQGRRIEARRRRAPHVERHDRRRSRASRGCSSARARWRSARPRAARARRSPPADGDGSMTLPAVVLIDTGTSGASELFASALAGNQRADLIGEHTIGRAASQKLVKLPDGTGLWLSTVRYLTPQGRPTARKRAGAHGPGRRSRRRVWSAGPDHRPDSGQGDRAAEREKGRLNRVIG